MEHKTPIRVRSNATPTFWNIDAAVGFAIGSLPGMIIGGLIGKDRMQREAVEGKELRPIGLFNKGLASGFIWGSVLAVASIVALSFFAAVAPSTVLATSYTVGLLIPPLGAIAGAKSYKERNNTEYELAWASQQEQSKAQAQALEHSQGKGKAKEHTLEHDASPQTSYTHEKSWASRVNKPAQAESHIQRLADQHASQQLQQLSV